MLGKRTRSIHPIASNCSFMDLHLPRPAPTSPSPSPPIPQIIGFNPTHDRSDKPIRFNTFMPPDGLPFPADPPCPAPRSSVFPRSALQTLLAAARQAAELNDGGSDPVTASPSLAGASRAGLVNHSENFQGSTANRVLTEANDTFSTDFEFSLASLEGKNSVRMSNINTTTPLSFNRERNCSMIGTSREAKAKSLSESRHFLFLATSPLTSDVSTFSPMINFLDACDLCKRPLGNGLDIFMYRGDTAFCSAECRYQQILVDERKEKSSPSTLRSGSGSASYIHGHNRRSQVMQPTGTAAAA